MLGVVMPWRPQPGRLAAHDHVVAWLGDHLPGTPIFEVDTDHEPYNLAAARNAGVRAAETAGCSTVVIIDADTIITPARYLHEAIATCGDGRLHMPFRDQRYLSEHETATLLRGGPVPTDGHLGNGACYVLEVAAYWRAGGGEERFSGWGGDDDAFVAAATALLGPVIRHRGVALSLWHPAVRDVGSDRHRPNAELAARYWAARHNAAAMRALIAEREVTCTQR